MLFRALIPSPLGPVLLESDGACLSGLYFTDQRDLPRISGVAPAPQVVSDPTAGIRDGRAIRSFKIVRRPPAGANLALFADDDTASMKAAGRADDRCAADAGKAAPMQLLQDDTPAGPRAVLQQTRQELDEYWQGKRRDFQVPLAPRGTAFQLKVWQALLKVPCGETLSYGQLALAAGMGAGHGRAVGTAVGSNPISIIIPCHRILSRNGALNGYGGGLERKIRLLEIEGLTLAPH